MFFAHLITGMGFSSIVPFLPLYIKSLGSTTGLSIELLSGLVYSCQAFSMMISSPIWGTLADRYGRKLMVERAMFGGSLILFLMSFVQSAEQLVLLRAFQGLVTGVVGAVNALVASAVPRKHSGYAMGLLQVGFGAGIALGPMLGGAMADAFGYRAAFYATSTLLFLAGVTVWLGVKEEFNPVKDQTLGRSQIISKWREILVIPGVLITYFMNFLGVFGQAIILPIIPLFVVTLTINPTLLNTFTGLVTGVSSAATTLSAAFLGRLGDRVGHRRILIASFFFTAIIYFPQSLVEKGWQLLVLYALVGVGMGGIVPSINALLAHFTPSGEEGAVYGIDNSIRAGARTLAPMFGSVMAFWFGLRGAYLATAFFFLFATFLAILRLPKPKPLPKGNLVP
jgi:DHA1 family multidrug resistance protein-like MFS transporter